MSIRVMTKIWDEGPENQGELLVLLALSDFADDEGYCWPSMARIARKARMSERNVRRVVRKLEDEGYLKTVQSSGRTSNKYQILTNPDKMSASQPGQNVRVPTRTNDAPTRTNDALNPDTAMSGESSLTINKKRHRRARGISETDSITDKMVEAASSKGIDADQAKRIYEQFRDYHIAKGSTFKDWDAAFRTWLRNAERFGELPKPQRKAGDWQWHEDKGCWHRRSWNEVAQCYGDEWR